MSHHEDEARTGQSGAVLLSVADRLYLADRAQEPIEPVAAQLGWDIGQAYKIQEALIQRRIAEGASRIGRKVGLTAPAVQKQLGVDQPDFGVLLSDMRLEETDALPLSKMIAPRIEAEIAFLIGKDILDPRRDNVIDATDWAAPAFEVVDSRIEGWRIGITDTIADNASSAYFVLGAARRRLDAFAPRDVQMTLADETGQTLSCGSGTDCMGDPIDALVWVAENAARLGRPLLAGEIVLSGALGPMVTLVAGHRYSATISGLGNVTTHTLDSEGNDK